MEKSPNLYQAGLCGRYYSNILPQTTSDIQVFSPTKLKEPCEACGYTSGNLIKMWGDRAAVKCGGCDTYQYSIILPKKKKGRAK